MVVLGDWNGAHVDTFFDLKKKTMRTPSPHNHNDEVEEAQPRMWIESDAVAGESQPWVWRPWKGAKVWKRFPWHPHLVVV